MIIGGRARGREGKSGRGKGQERGRYEWGGSRDGGREVNPDVLEMDIKERYQLARGRETERKKEDWIGVDHLV
jgi:hypothetical protein